MKPPPLPESFRVTFQIPREVLVRILWRRVMQRRHIFIVSGLCILLAGLCIFIGGSTAVAGCFLLVFALVRPFAVYLAIARGVGNHPQLTDPKTVDFSQAGIVASGSNWRTELPWTMYKGFSEDGSYFFLHISDNGMASVLPKSAFTAQQQSKFREFADIPRSA